MISRISFSNFQVRANAQQKSSNVNFRAQDSDHSLSVKSNKVRPTLDDLRKAENGSEGNLTECANTYSRFQDIDGLKKSYIQLKDSSFSQSDIKNTSFQNCIFYKSYFINTKFVKNVDVNGSSFIGCDFRRANLTGLVNWEKVDFSRSWYDAETVFPKGFDPAEKRMKMPAADQFMPSNK